jgi:DNA-directed RNA polymerase specialized sigma24 family protein
VATELGCRREVDAWVEDALGRAHADSGLVPHGARLRHVLCQLTDVIRGETWRTSPEPDPAWADLAVLPFDQRAAVVLHRTAQLPMDECAAVLHMAPEELDSLLATADRVLQRGAGPGTDR